MHIVETDDFVRISEAATSLGVSQAAIRVAIAENRLTVTMDHGIRWISKVDLEAYRARTQSADGKPKGRPKGAKDLKKRKTKDPLPIPAEEPYADH
jgi:hypothetical protein